MARTTDDAEELLGKEQDQNTEDGTEEVLKEEPADSTGEEPESGDEEPEAGSDAAQEKESGKEPEEEPEEKPEGKPEEEPEEKQEEEPEEDPKEEPQIKVKKPGKSRRPAPKKAKAIDEDLEEDDSEEGGMGLNLFTLLVLLIAAAITVGYYTCTVKTVKVSGNHLYTSEEIAAQVISDDSQLRHNTLFLTALYMTPKAPGIPFEESVKVSLESYDTIRITVKDMDIAGFIPYAGKNLYFSADGIVLENSPLTVKNATFVTGLSVTGAERGQKMTSDDEAGLAMILETLQILRKYQMEVECVVLSDSSGIIIYMDDIKIYMGRTDFELKISKISQILPYLEGRSGTINLVNYTSADQNIILK